MVPLRQSQRIPVRTIGAVTATLGIAALLLLSAFGIGSSAVAHPQGFLRVMATELSVTVTFSPNPVSSGSSTQISVTISGPGARSPFFLWFNNSPPGCQSGSGPVTANGPGYSGNCNPTQSGTFTVHVGVTDSNATAIHHGNGSAMLTVNSNGGNNNGGKSNNNSNGSFNLFSGLGGVFSLLILFGAVFLGALVAIAAGTIATAVAVSRRLRQINETLKQTIPPATGKPPT